MGVLEVRKSSVLDCFLEMGRGGGCFMWVTVGAYGELMG